MTYKGKNKQKSFIAEGRLYYNEDTIIFIPEKARINEKDIENFSKQPQYVWYYTITDGVLELEDGRPFIWKLSTWPNTGEFHKTN